MIHRDRSIIARPGLRMEHRVGGKRARNRKSFGAKAIAYRSNDDCVLVSQDTAFAGMRIESRNGNPSRFGNTEVFAQGAVGDSDSRFEKFGAQCFGNFRYRNMRRDWHDLQFIAGKHHDGLPAPGKKGKKLGLPRKGKASVDHEFPL